MFQLHMFDVDLGPRMKITESELNVGGNSLTTVDTGLYKQTYFICSYKYIKVLNASRQDYTT